MSEFSETSPVMEAGLLKIKVGGAVIAHITSARLRSTHAPRVVESNDTYPGEIKLPGKITWSVTFSSYAVMTGVLSLKYLLEKHLARGPVTIEFTTEESGEVYVSGSGIITELDTGGNTADSGDINGTIDGVGLYNIGVVGTGTTTLAPTTTGV